MPRTSRAEEIYGPETKEVAPHIGFTTESSENHPKKEKNEDATLLDREKQIAAVFDGMGGGISGREASNLVSETISKELSAVPEGADAKKWEATIKKAMEVAQEEVLKLGNKLFFEYLNDPFVAAAYKDRPQGEIEKLIEERGMSPTGTTASIVKMLERPDGGADLVFGHTGDSRIYILKASGKLEQITRDQGALEQAIQAGYITEEEADFLDQTTNEEEIIKKFCPDRGATISF
ncbi:MAG: protein phosphatase 2C domain-containing protein, partial [Patescibacteria group bacterium]